MFLRSTIFIKIANDLPITYIIDLFISNNFDLLKLSSNLHKSEFTASMSGAV